MDFEKTLTGSNKQIAPFFSTQFIVRQIKACEYSLSPSGNLLVLHHLTALSSASPHGGFPTTIFAFCSPIKFVASSEKASLHNRIPKDDEMLSLYFKLGKYLPFFICSRMQGGS